MVDSCLSWQHDVSVAVSHALACCRRWSYTPIAHKQNLIFLFSSGVYRQFQSGGAELTGKIDAERLQIKWMVVGEILADRSVLPCTCLTLHGCHQQVLKFIQPAYSTDVISRF